MRSTLNPYSAHLCDVAEIRLKRKLIEKMNCIVSLCIYGVHQAAEAALNHQTTNQPTAL